MCGIVGYIGKSSAKPILIEGLRRLEYRGYDSAGVALHRAGDDFLIRRCVGQVQSLVDMMGSEGEKETQGIAHTRWATHGVPSEINAHPHKAGYLVLVHNGIIENHAEIKSKLLAKGISFSSQTDTEVFAQLIESHRIQLTEAKKTHFKDLSLEDRKSILLEAMKRSMNEVVGHYAILFMSQYVEGHIFGAQMGAPLVASQIPTGTLVASDLQAIVPYGNQILFIPNGTYFEADAKSFHFYESKNGKTLNLSPETIEWSADRVAKDGYEHYMLKEIYQQPLVTADTLSGRLPEVPGAGFRWDMLKDPKGQVKNHDEIWSKVKRLYLIGCGTSYHASLVGKYFFERWARIPVEVDLASEFRYRGPILEPDSLVGVISQSGETADTLAAIRLANEMGTPTFSIVNVPGSSIMRETTFSYPTKAGPEIGVASTKAFTSQITVLSLLALDVARIRKKFSPDQAAENIQSLARLPHYMEVVLARAKEYVDFGASLKDKRTILFLGRGTMYPIALEGALKLKEITYRHAEGYAAGELKHGPLALVDDGLAAIVLAPTDELLHKTLSNLEEIKSRKGYIIGIGREDNKEFASLCNHYVPMPEAPWSLNPMLYVVPLQLISYGLARAFGREIDKPRNLAKSVTVE